MKQYKHKLFAAAALTLAIASLAACGSSSTTSTTSTAAGSGASSSAGSDAVEVRTLTYAFTNTLNPVSYIDADGNPAGYDVEVIKAIDELLPQYEIELVGTTSEDAWLGTQNGKYQLCTTNSVRTAEREGIYLFANTNQGAFLYGLIVRNEDADTIVDLDSLAASDKSVVPLRPSDAPCSVFNAYNEEHAGGDQIEFETIDSLENPDAIRYVAEGRYDVFPFGSTLWVSLVTDEAGQLHDLADQLVFNPFQTTATYALINADETEFRDAYQDALQELKDNGTISELSKEYLGFDLLEFCDEHPGASDPS